MKKLSLLTLALSTTFATSLAAQNTPCPCPCPQAFQGFYFGGSVGYGIGSGGVNENTTVTDTANGTMPYSANPSLSLKGVDGGIMAGYLHRFGNWGLGADFLANWTSASASQTTNTSPPYFSGPANIQSQTNFVKLSLQNSLQVRGVFSYVINNLIMPKIMLGWDGSQYTLTDTSNFYSPNSGAPVSWSTSTTGKKRLSGFLWGAGVDFLVAENIVFGLEYTGVTSQKVTFNSSNNTVSGQGVTADTISTVSSVSLNPQYNTFKATLRYVY